MFEFMVFLGCVLYIPLSVQLLKGTFLEISWQRKSFAGIILGKEIFLLILPGILLYSFGIYKEYTYFYVTDASVREATIYALYALFAFTLTISLVTKVFFRSRYLLIGRSPEITEKDRVLLGRLYRVTLLCILLVLGVLTLGGMRHALLSSLLSGGDLMEIRLQNRYATGIPTVVMSFFRFLFTLGGVLLGVNYSRLSKTKRVFGASVLIFAASFFGDKTPIFSVIVLAILAGLSIENKFSVIKIMKYSLLTGGISLVILYVISYIQFGGIGFSEFLEFLVFRAGLGQIGGLYEQFSIKLRNSAYIWHSVPFANLMFDYPVYNKDLMMLLWGANVAENETGVVNSFFVGEAYAIGGELLALLSPIAVAINYCVAIVLLTSFFRRFFGYSLGAARVVLQLLIPSIFILTGDIAGLLFGKLLVMILFFCIALLGMQAIFYRRRR